ncbi:hypothetical protein BOTBODRAFT_47877 [Botryobasidium botryosum FD-172 SS1]|uniref:Clr5 domain-containing protein n=1 Tax=Botryobasidium botryosum (strain FD-172 SS1) TaxID=930990 RepID=A0A067MAZ8_BOTB1|nr:hypothetical protein BOTBODRAFT_47877 [Botryobasidium botryosum FD-172 SS1]
MVKPWETYKELIHEHYIVQNKTLEEVRKLLKDEHGFEASERAYKNMLDKWSYFKHKRRQKPTTFGVQRSVRSSRSNSSGGDDIFINVTGDPSAVGSRRNEGAARSPSSPHPSSGPPSQASSPTHPHASRSGESADAALSDDSDKPSWQVLRQAIKVAVDLSLRSPASSDAGPSSPASWLEKIITTSGNLNDWVVPEKGFLKSSGDVDGWATEEVSGKAPLHLAIMHRATLMIEYLIDAGADVNVRDKDGNSPLHVGLRYHAWDHEPSLVRRLLQAGADANSHSGNGLSPLHVAIQHHASLPTIDLLLKAGASIHAKDRQGFTPLAFAICCRASESDLQRIGLDEEEIQLRAVAAVQLLLEHGADPNARTAFELSPLETAIRRRAPDAILRSLLQANADVNARDMCGLSPLDLAIMSNAPHTTIGYLLQAGAHFDTQNAAGESPLHRAISQGAWWTVDLLLEAGALVNVTTVEGNTPLHMVARVNDLSDAGLIVTALLNAGAEVDARNVNGHTPLAEFIISRLDHRLAGGRYMDRFYVVVQKLLEAGADRSVFDAAMTTRRRPDYEPETML